MARLWSDRDQIAELLDLLRRTEIDAAEACRTAADLIRDEPLTRGTLLSFQAEHEQHRRELEKILPSFGLPRGRTATELTADPAIIRGERGTTAMLRIIRKNAEIAVRRYQAALRVVPEALIPTIRAQCNAWLRHRAWLTARIEAFARTRGSYPSFR
jgi:rubrerythrin